MTSHIKIPLKELTEQTIKDLQERYPYAEVSLNINPEDHYTSLKEEEFWQLISIINWEAKDDRNKLEPLVQKLKALSVRKIYDFADLLSKFIYNLDNIKFAKNIGIDAWKNDHEYFSVDNFLYARLCVIANGENFYKEVINHPPKMPKDLTFEDLLYVAAEAYQSKTNKPFNYSPSFNMETYSNKEGWSQS